MSENGFSSCGACGSCLRVADTNVRLMQFHTFTVIEKYHPQTQTQVRYYTEMLAVIVDSPQHLPEALRDLGEDAFRVVVEAVQSTGFTAAYGEHLLVKQPDVAGKPPCYVLLLGIQGVNEGASSREPVDFNTRGMCALFGFVVEMSEKYDVTRLLVSFEKLSSNNVDVLASAALLRCRCRRTEKVSGTHLPEVLVICSAEEKPRVELGLGISDRELCDPCTEPKLK